MSDRLRRATWRHHGQRPRLSIVVVATSMSDAGTRALASLAPTYQEGVEADDYEVILVDHGAEPPLSAAVVPGWNGLRVCRVDRREPPTSPIRAGVDEARGESVGVVDAASLASPGLVRSAITAAWAHPTAAVTTFNWDLGYDLVTAARDAGWTPAEERRLLAEIEWPADGYALFRFATLDLPSFESWFAAVSESHAFFLPAGVWDRITGGDPPVELDGDASAVLATAARLDDVEWVLLLSEATFRQVEAASDGAPTSAPSGRPVVARRPAVLGGPPNPVPPQLARALEGLLWVDAEAPRGLGDAPTRADALETNWVHWAQVLTDHGRIPEAIAFARRARQAAPRSSEWARFVRSVTRADTIDSIPAYRRAAYHSLAGDVFERLGHPREAAEEFAAALEAEPTNAPAYSGLSRLRMPGPMYDEVLRWVHEHLVPPTYLEIGVFEGASLSLARPPTVAVGIDPQPIIKVPISVEYHLYPERSSDFFDQHDVRKLLGGGPSLVFIDGLHHFPVVLDDFRHVEAISDPETIVVLHDVMPFDELTQRPERACEFYTGDCWKLLHCLADARPDLSWFTVPTAPSGLAFVSGLDPSSSVLWDRYGELVDRYRSLDFERAADVPGPVVENQWDAIAAALANIRPVAHRGASPPTVPVETNTPDILANRIRVQADALRDQERATNDVAAQLQHAEERVAALGRELVQYEAQLAAAHAELEAFHRSRVLRVTRPIGRVLRQLRRWGSPNRP
jgi:hypothetical protein